MADYRELKCPYGDDFEGGDECDRCEQYELCMETPTADVIERAKIDKAIEELRREIENNNLNIIKDSGTEWIAKGFVYGAINRCISNIGE